MTNSRTDVQSFDSSNQEADGRDQSYPYDEEPALFDFATGDTDDESVYGTHVSGTYDGMEDLDFFACDETEDIDNSSTCDCSYRSPEFDQLMNLPSDLGLQKTDNELDNAAAVPGAEIGAERTLETLATVDSSEFRVSYIDNLQNECNSETEYDDLSSNSAEDFWQNDIPWNASGPFGQFGSTGEIGGDFGFDTGSL